ncbi:hypothetical protein V502_10354 [Pseudogymnoascus sp. VKM F-4520 (FW-2644)]|nr:hypothetical protein V502_10354 [Pseudogymnoascus sp. VKM F-4520 (FW-2644)]
MYACAVKPSCTIPPSWIIKFDADPDIDGIGFIAAFYTASFLTVIILTATYITSDLGTFTNFGFCKLDENFFAYKQKKNFHEALRKATLVLSDQQLLTGVAMAIAGLIKHCEITQYHFNTVINLVLAATIAHSMTFSFIADYTSENSFFRIWRALAMLLLGALCMGIFIVTGNNNWLSVYGLPAQCGYDNLRDGFSPPATISLGLLYWFLIRGYAFSFTVLIPTSKAAQLFSVFLSSAFWLAKICKYITIISAYFDSKLANCWESMSVEPGLVVASLRYPHFNKTMQQLSYGAWFFVSIFTKLLHASVYGIAQVWASYAFALCWTCYTLAGSAELIAIQRKTATENGMQGSQNQWGYGQLLKNPPLGDSDSASVKSSEGAQDQISTPPEEVGNTAPESYYPPEQGPLSRQSTLNLRDEQRVLHCQEMETKLWDNRGFQLYIGDAKTVPGY